MSCPNCNVQNRCERSALPITNDGETPSFIISRHLRCQENSYPHDVDKCNRVCECPVDICRLSRYENAAHHHHAAAHHHPSAPLHRPTVSPHRPTASLHRHNASLHCPTASQHRHNAPQHGRAAPMQRHDVWRFGTPGSGERAGADPRWRIRIRDSANRSPQLLVSYT